MAKYGFIGFGSMAKMMVKGFISFANMPAGEFAITRNDKSKLNEISEMFGGVAVCGSNAEVAQQADCIFICTRPMDVKSALEDICEYVTPDKHVISIAATVGIKNIEKLLLKKHVSCKVSKLIPTLTGEIGEGVSLICHNANVGEDAASLELTLSKIGKIKVLSEEDMGFASELTSCAPGFIASIAENFSKSASLHSGLSTDEINDMILHTLYASAKYMLETRMNYEHIVTRVATKGGITIEGVEVFNRMLPEVFGQVFTNTLNKRRASESVIDKSYE